MTTRTAPLDATLRVAPFAAHASLLLLAVSYRSQIRSSSCLACAANGGDADAIMKWETL
jgi:hypothetical protein